MNLHKPIQGSKKDQYDLGQFRQRFDISIHAEQIKINRTEKQRPYWYRNKLRHLPKSATHVK